MGKIWQRTYIYIYMHIYMCIFNCITFLYMWNEHRIINSILKIHIKKEKKNFTGFPWWLSGKESTCQCRRHGFDLWSTRMPHAKEQLTLCATTIELCSRAQEPQLLKPPHPRACALQQEKPLQWEAHAPQLESSPCSPQLETSLRSDKGPAQPEINNK